MWDSFTFLSETFADVRRYFYLQCFEKYETEHLSIECTQKHHKTNAIKNIVTLNLKVHNFSYNLLKHPRPLLHQSSREPIKVLFQYFRSQSPYFSRPPTGRPLSPGLLPVLLDYCQEDHLHQITHRSARSAALPPLTYHLWQLLQYNGNSRQSFWENRFDLHGFSHLHQHSRELWFGWCWLCARNLLSAAARSYLCTLVRRS